MNFLEHLLKLFSFLFCCIIIYSITFASYTYVEIFCLALYFQEIVVFVLQ